jgi:hypothetical protein
MLFISRTQEVQNYLFKIVPEELSKVSDTLLTGVILLSWFKRFNKTKDIVLNEDMEKLAALIAKEFISDNVTVINKDENKIIGGDEVIKNSIEYAEMLITCLYPEEKGLIDFKKKLNHFPYNLLLLKGENNVIS